MLETLLSLLNSRQRIIALLHPLGLLCCSEWTSKARQSIQTVDEERINTQSTTETRPYVQEPLQTAQKSSNINLALHTKQYVKVAITNTDRTATDRATAHTSLRNDAAPFLLNSSRAASRYARSAHRGVPRSLTLVHEVDI